MTRITAPLQKVMKLLPALQRGDWHMLLGGLTGGTLWHLLSRLDSTAPMGKDWLTPSIIVAMPMVFLALRKPLDRFLAPVEKLRSSVPPKVLWIAGIALPFALSFYFHHSSYEGNATGQEYEFARKTTIWSTLLTYLLFRSSGGSRTSFMRLKTVIGAGGLTVITWGLPAGLSLIATNLHAEESRVISRTYEVKVGPWTHTGIIAKPGVSYDVKAEGSLKFPKDMWGGHSTGPNGFYELGFTAWNLKGKIGEKGRLRELGSEGSLYTDQEGEILLAPTHTYEPNPAVFGKIGGGFKVTITGVLPPGPLESPLAAGLVAAAITVLVNGAMVFQKPPKPGKDGEQAASYTMDVRTEGQRTQLVADGSDRLWVYAKILCSKAGVNADALTSAISFTFGGGKYADWMSIVSTQSSGGYKAVLVCAKPPSAEAEVEEGAKVILTVAGQTAEGEAMEAPVTLELSGELNLDLEVLE